MGELLKFRTEKFRTLIGWGAMNVLTRRQRCGMVLGVLDVEVGGVHG